MGMSLQGAAMSIYPAEEKVRSLAEAAALVGDGSVVGLGGALSLREPMALIRELVRQGRLGLHLVGNAHGVDVDLLCGAGAVGTAELTYVGFEFDFGVAANYRRACEEGQVQVRESNCVTLINQLRAAAFGLPFVALGSFGGSDILRLHPEFREMTSPLDGERVIVAPPLRPDVALLHVHYADSTGNARIEEPLASDVLLARAAATVILSAERLVSPQEMRELGPNIPYFEVTAVVEAPYGAHPTSCYPFYAYDREHLAEYMAAAQGGPEAFAAYLQRYVYGLSEEEYVHRLKERGVPERLGRWREGAEAWQELFTAGRSP